MKRVLKRAKLATHFSPHCLRHTFAVLHIERGDRQRGRAWLQEQMGHSSITLTRDLYGRWWKQRDREAADGHSEVVTKLVTKPLALGGEDR